MIVIALISEVLSRYRPCPQLLLLDWPGSGSNFLATRPEPTFSLDADWLWPAPALDAHQAIADNAQAVRQLGADKGLPVQG